MDDSGSITIRKVPISAIGRKTSSHLHQNETRRSSVPNARIQIQINDLSNEPLNKNKHNQKDSVDGKDDIDTFNFTYYGHMTIDRRNVPSVFPWIAKRILKANSADSKQVKVYISKTKLWLKEVNNETTLHEHQFDSIYRLSRINKCHMDDYLAYIITNKIEQAASSFHLMKCSSQTEKNEFLNILKTRVLGFQKVSVPLAAQSKNMLVQNHNLSTPTRPTHKRGASSGAILVSPLKEDPVFIDSVYYIGKVTISQPQVPPKFIDNVIVRLRKIANQNSNDMTIIRSGSGTFVHTHHKRLSFDLGGLQQRSLSTPVSNKIPSERKRSSSMNDNSAEQQESFKQEVATFKDSLINGTDNVDVGDDEIDGSVQLSSINEEVHSRLIKVQVSKTSLSLFSVESQNLVFEKKIQNISFCTKGEASRDHFGFICREGGKHICYILQGESEQKVDTIMTAMKNAFTEALQASQHLTLCDTCPLQSLHKLCNLLEGTNSIAEKDGMVDETIKILSEYEQLHVLNEVNEEDPDNDSERIEITLNTLRELFDQKQASHKHLHKVQNYNLLDDDNKEEHEHPKTHLSPGIFMKARKSLTTSFHNFTMKKMRSMSFLPFVNENDDTAVPPAGPSLLTRGQNIGNDRTQNTQNVEKPRSRSLENSPDVPEFNRTKTKIELKVSNPEESAGGESVDLPESGMQDEAVEESKDQFSDVEQKNTPVKEHRPLRRESSWRQAIYQSVVTPSRRSSSSSIVTLPGDNEEKKYKEVTVDISARARSRWRNAIMNQILLIRMEKENKKLAANISATEIRRQKLSYTELCQFTAEAASAWDDVLSTKSNEKVDKQILMDIIRGGVPRARRGEVWPFLIKQHSICSPDTSEKQIWKETPYRTLLKKNTSHQHAILIDLGRTFPTHAHFIPRLGSGQISLFNILKAYSLLDDEVGYCQGLSFVAGILLMHMSEEDAFKCFCHVMFDLQIRNQYKPDMYAVRQQLYQLSRLLHDYHPKVYAHFNKHDVTPTLYAAPWFLTLYASQYPIGFVSRVMDMVLFGGLEVIFKVALVLIGNHVEEILQRDSFESVVNYLKSDLPEKVISETDDICARTLNMDIKQQLNLYEVEYQLLNEEMIDTRQNKEKYEKQEQLLQDTRKQLADMRNELDHAKNEVIYLQHSLHEANRKNDEYEKRVQMLIQENQKLRTRQTSPHDNNNTDSDVISVTSNDSSNRGDIYFDKLLEENNRDEKNWHLVPGPLAVEQEIMTRGISTDSSQSKSSEDSLYVTPITET